MLTLGPRSADGSLRTAVAKAIILPLWGPRGIDQLESYDFGAERKRLKSPDRCLFNRAKRVMDGCLLWLSEKGAEGKCRLTLMRVGST